jgi:hypothetical protein
VLGGLDAVLLNRSEKDKNNILPVNILGKNHWSHNKQ